MNGSNRIYTRSECRSKQVLGVILMLGAFYFLFSALLGRLLLFKTLGRILHNSRYSDSELGGTVRILCALMGVVFGALSGLAFALPTRALRYMDIHNVSAVSRSDLQAWKSGVQTPPNAWQQTQQTPPPKAGEAGEGYRFYFCEQCGTRLRAPIVTQGSLRLTCPKCGHVFQVGGK